jgi:hypothetical protein
MTRLDTYFERNQRANKRAANDAEIALRFQCERHWPSRLSTVIGVDNMPWNSKEPRWQGAKKRKDNARTFRINSPEYDRVPYGQGPDDLDHPEPRGCLALNRSFPAR